MFIALKNQRCGYIKTAFIVALSFIAVGCTTPLEPISSLPTLTKSQLVEMPNAQVVVTFPEVNPSSRFYVNNRGTFKAYKGRGQLLIQNHNAQSADIYINNQKIDVNQLSANTLYNYSLAKNTHNGVNTFKVENILPAGASLTLRFAFPTLSDEPKKNIDFTEVDTLIKRDVKAGFPGAVLAVIKNGELIKLTAYGDAKQYQQSDLMLLRPEPMQINTLFDLASNTKIFATNFALMKLVSEELLNINKPVQSYLSEYTGEGRVQRIVKDLLTHSAGYPPVFD
ncbi:serine hydrolase, partial [Pseudoalteromonas sp. SG41-6]